MPYTDGFKHVARIATEANIDINIVKSCLKNLVYVMFLIHYDKLLIKVLVIFNG